MAEVPHDFRRPRRDNALARVRPVLAQHGPVGIGQARHEMGLYQIPAVGDNRKRPGHLRQGHGDLLPHRKRTHGKPRPRLPPAENARAFRTAKITTGRPAKPEPADPVFQTFLTEHGRHLDHGDVARFGKTGVKRLDPELVVIANAVTVGIERAPLAVNQRTGGHQTQLDRRGSRHDFERRAGFKHVRDRRVLPLFIRKLGELVGVVRGQTGQRQDGARVGIHDNPHAFLGLAPFQGRRQFLLQRMLYRGVDGQRHVRAALGRHVLQRARLERTAPRVHTRHDLPGPYAQLMVVQHFDAAGTDPLPVHKTNHMRRQGALRIKTDRLVFEAQTGGRRVHETLQAVHQFRAQPPFHGNRLPEPAPGIAPGQPRMYLALRLAENLRQRHRERPGILNPGRVGIQRPGPAVRSQQAPVPVVNVAARKIEFQGAFVEILFPRVDVVRKPLQQDETSPDNAKDHQQRPEHQAHTDPVRAVDARLRAGIRALVSVPAHLVLGPWGHQSTRRSSLRPTRPMATSNPWLASHARSAGQSFTVIT